MKKTFGYKHEKSDNPYIGFCSFQHFKGEKLYSDVIVDHSKNMTETENYECYPVPEYVPQEGRSQGFYHDGSVAYIRCLWKEFEPVQGEYHYEFIEDILDKADKAGQTVLFRLMAHSTRACDDVPDWMRALVECPERPDGKRVKDSPKDPLFWELFCKAVRKLGERFDGDERLDAIDVSVPGAWGEGHKLEEFSDDIMTLIMNTYLDVFKNTHLIAQIGIPKYVKYLSEHCSVGWRGDGVGHLLHMNELYPTYFASLPDGLWKKAPVSFESYWWLGEWQRQGWNIDDIFAFLLDKHVSTFNGKNFPIPESWHDKVEAFENKMGYHFVIDSFEAPDEAGAGEKAEFTLCIDNVGVAPIYRALPLHLVLSDGKNRFEFVPGCDIRSWLPGKHTESLSVTLPTDIPGGEYECLAAIIGKDGKTKVFFCTDAEYDGDYVKLGKLLVK